MDTHMTEQRNTKDENKHRDKRDPNSAKQRTQSPQHGEMTQTRCTQTTETYQRTYVS